VTRNTLLSDKMSLIFFELPKLPKEIKADNSLELWLQLFKAKTEEELNTLAELGVPEVREAIEAYHQITATSEFQEAERLRFKARHDEAQALYNAERRGETSKAFDIARRMLARHRPISEITEDTGLTREDIENLQRS
jgi:predicted transposase/invertase (TIGR01784 family)